MYNYAETGGDKDTSNKKMCWKRSPLRLVQYKKNGWHKVKKASGNCEEQTFIKNCVGKVL